MVGVVVRQDLVDGQAGLGQLALGLAVHDAAGGVGGAIRSIGAQRKDQRHSITHSQVRTKSV